MLPPAEKNAGFTVPGLNPHGADVDDAAIPVPSCIVCPHPKPFPAPAEPCCCPHPSPNEVGLLPTTVGDVLALAPAPVVRISTRTTGSGCQSISSPEPRPTPTSSLQLSRISVARDTAEAHQSRSFRFARRTALHSVQKRERRAGGEEGWWGGGDGGGGADEDCEVVGESGG